MRRLYLQLYLAFLLVAGFSVAAAAGAAHVLYEPRGEVPLPMRHAADWLAEALPSDPAGRALMVYEVAARLDVEIQVSDADGAMIAASGATRVPPGEGWFGGPGYTGMRVRTARGPVVAAVVHDHWGGGSPAWGLALVALFGAMALGCYPIARRITRRLESLRATSDRWAAGDLSARACVRGHDEVAELAIGFNRAAARVEALVEAQRRLLANASHELRSPLSRLRMALALIDDGDGPPERRALHDEAGRDIDELDQLIGDLLLGARLEAGQDRARWVPVDLGALVAEEAARVGATVTGAPFSVPGDASMLRRLIRNLAENARRYAGTDVEVIFEPRTLVIADRGPGVAPEHRERIWEPFWRPPGHSESDGGVGLGLSLVRQIARFHGAEVNYVPREGGGSRFEVRWREADA